MESKEKSFDDLLWNKYDKIQKEFDESQAYYQNLIKYLREMLTEIDRHESYLSILYNAPQLKNFSKLNELFNLFNQNINFNIQNRRNFIKDTISSLDKSIAKLKKINPIYLDFKQYLENYTTLKKKFIKAKEKFHESVSSIEKQTLLKIKEGTESQESNNIEISNKLKKEVSENLKKYQSNIEQINKKREEFISRQKNLIKSYVDIESFNINMYYDILGNFLFLEKEKQFVFFNSAKFNKLQKEKKEKNINKEIKEYFNNFEVNNKDDEKNEILFEGYKSKIDFDKCTSTEDAKNFSKAIDIIEKDFKDIFDKITLEKEKSKKKIREWTKKFFELDKNNIEFDKDSMEKYYYPTLKFPYTHKSFLKIVSDLRSNSQFKRNKQLIDLLGKAFKIILAEAKIRKNLYNAKNCIILSQTFYYLDNNKKIFATEFLKKDTWLSDKNFWIEFCSYVIDEELKQLGISNSEINFDDIQKNKKYPEKLSSKINNIIFTQLCTLIQNIIFFTNNSSLVMEIIEKYKEKYSYLTENNIKILKSLIFSDKPSL